MGEIREKLFFPGNHSLELEDAGLELRVIDQAQELFGARDEQKRFLKHHIGYKQGRKQVIVFLAIFLECIVHLVFSFPEGVKPDLFDLRNAELNTFLNVFLAVRANRLRG